MIARSCARLAVVEQHRALVGIEAAGRVAGRDHDLLQRPHRLRRRRGAPASGRSGSRPPAGGSSSGAAGAARPARARGARPPSPRCTRSIGSSSRTSASDRIKTLMRRVLPSASCSRRREAQLERLERGLQVLRPARADDDRRHVRMREQPRERERGRRRRPRRAPRASKASSASKTWSSCRCAVGLGAHRHPRARRQRLAAPVLAGQPAAGERAERRVAEPLARAQRRARRLRRLRGRAASRSSAPSRAGRGSSASSSHGASTLLPPYARILPSATSSSKAPIVSASGVSGSISCAR